MVPPSPRRLRFSHDRNRRSTTMKGPARSEAVVMRRVHVAVLGLSVVCFLSAAGRVQAQGSGDGFLFRAPQGEISIRGGLNHASAGSDLFSFTESQLTVDARDFSSLTFATDVDIAFTPRL